MIHDALDNEVPRLTIAHGSDGHTDKENENNTANLLNAKLNFDGIPIAHPGL